MASSNSAGFDLQQAVAVIHVLKQTGMLESALRAADQSKLQVAAESCAEPSAGSMHDGSKRRLFSADELETGEEMDEFDVISSVSEQIQKQGPILAKSKDVTAGSGYELPPGVETVEIWGKTICTLPKVAGRRLTYQKLIDDASVNSDTKEYLI